MWKLFYLRFEVYAKPGSRTVHVYWLLVHVCCFNSLFKQIIFFCITFLFFLSSLLSQIGQRLPLQVSAATYFRPYIAVSFPKRDISRTNGDLRKSNVDLRKFKRDITEKKARAEFFQVAYFLGNNIDVGTDYS